MPRTVEHRVEMHQLATSRRQAGLPVWRYHVAVGAYFHDDDLPVKDKAKLLAADIKASKWYRRQEEREESELWQAVEELEYLAEGDVDEQELDYIWDQIYNIADYDRAWINVFTSVS